MSKTKKARKPTKAQKALDTSPKHSVDLKNGKAAIRVWMSNSETVAQIMRLYSWETASLAGNFSGSLAQAKLYVTEMATAITKAERLEGAVASLYPVGK